MQKFNYFLGERQPFEVYTNHVVLKTLMTHENLSLQRIQWIKKMVPFNYIIHYRPGVKIGHTDFALKMNTFLSKKNTSESINTLRA